MIPAKKINDRNFFKKIKLCLELMADFFRFGCFTFGGGWSIVSQMQQLYVEKKKTISSDDLLDMIGVARSLPGTMIGNAAVLYGYRIVGVWGALSCLFSMVLPPTIILVIISLCYDVIRSNYWGNAAMEGVQAAVVPIIACAVLGLVNGSVKNGFGITIMLLSAILYIFLDIAVIWLISMGVVSGLVYGEFVSRNGVGKL